MVANNPAALGDAYLRIKKNILELRYQPGQKLSEARLAAELKLGRSPIRSALARLERDGWVRVVPQHGTFVRRFSPEDVAAIYELRLLLEAHAASVAAARMTREDLDLLRARFDALKAKGAAKHFFEEFLALDDLFHGTVYRSAGNAFITQILHNLYDQIHWIRVTTATLPGRVEESLLEMDRVLLAMERRDSAAAAKAMRQHIGNIAVSYRALPGKHDEDADAI